MAKALFFVVLWVFGSLLLYPFPCTWCLKNTGGLIAEPIVTDPWKKAMSEPH